jgi:hypothetical protein
MTHAASSNAALLSICGGLTFVSRIRSRPPKANEKDEKVQYVEVMYRQLKDTSHVYLYLKLGKEFITCGTNQKCIDSQRCVL